MARFLPRATCQLWASCRALGRNGLKVARRTDKKRGENPLGPPLFAQRADRSVAYEQPVKPPPALFQLQVMPEPLLDFEVPVKLTPALLVI